ncbi:MAG: hypothetical protein KAS64_10745 [Spirochaetes bacterium]|nr:hypothetical protein [Spirochaetota bacterium]
MFLVEWGSYGTASGQFINPTGLLLDNDGYFFVADKGNNRFQKFKFE